jgi:hypothetical protein
MEYPLSKYQFFQKYHDDDSIEIIAVSTYAGKRVKGRAKCDPSDNFDFEKGKELAAARCNAKIARKRRQRAAKKVKEAERLLNEAEAHYKKMTEYYGDAAVDYVEAKRHAEAFKANL